MSKILEEVRAISSDAIAKKQDAAKSKMPEILEQIKKAAALGKTECEFQEYQIDQYSKKLLEVEGFHLYCTTKQEEIDFRDYIGRRSDNKKVWKVSW